MKKKNGDLSTTLMNDQPTQKFITYLTIMNVKTRQLRQSELYLTTATPVSPSKNDCLVDLLPNLNDLTGIRLRFRMH